MRMHVDRGARDKDFVEDAIGHCVAVEGLRALPVLKDLCMEMSGGIWGGVSAAFGIINRKGFGKLMRVDIGIL